MIELGLLNDGSLGCRSILHCVLRLRGGGSAAASDKVSDEGDQSEVESDVSVAHVVVPPVRSPAPERVDSDDCSNEVIDLCGSVSN